MTDDVRQARELLARMYRATDYPPMEREATGIIHGRLGRRERAAAEAITAALRAAPEGFVMVPVEATKEMIRAALPHHWPYLGDEMREHYRRMLAARPSVIGGLDRLDDRATVSVPADDSKVVAVPAFRADEALTEIVQQRLNHGRNELTVAVDADVHGEKLHRVSGENLNADSPQGVKGAD